MKCRSVKGRVLASFKGRLAALAPSVLLIELLCAKKNFEAVVGKYRKVMLLSKRERYIFSKTFFRVWHCCSDFIVMLMLYRLNHTEFAWHIIFIKN